MALAALALANETRKGLLITWSYRFDTIIMLLKLSLFFFLISLVIGGGELDRERLASTLLGYIVWFYAAIGINNMSRHLMEEAQSGTLEQMYMTAAPSLVIMMGRSIATLISATSMIVFIVFSLILALGISVPMRWEGLPIFALIMVGLAGLGFIVGGATLLFKQTNQFANLVENFIMFLSGVLVPVQNLPGWLEWFSRALPATQGIIVLRDVVLDGQSLASAWADGSMGWLIVNSLLYFVIGWLIFKLSERIARKQGSMGQY